MVSVHMWVGSLVVLAYLVLTVVNFLAWRRGSSFSWARGLSMGAAGLLLIQIVLGFNLLGSDHSISALHYIFALATLVPVGLEHSMAKGKDMGSEKARMTAFATTATTVLVLIAYAIAESR